MIRKLFLVVTLIAATCAAGLLFGGSSLVPSSSAMTSAQNDNRDMNRRMGRRHRRHERRWHRRHRRGRRIGNSNR
jgi:hypothetical protein